MAGREPERSPEILGLQHRRRYHPIPGYPPVRRPVRTRIKRGPVIDDTVVDQRVTLVDDEASRSTRPMRHPRSPVLSPYA